MARLHHVALGARDVWGVATFYVQGFGLRVLSTHDYDDGTLRSVWLDLEPGVLMVEHTEEPALRVEGVGPGPFLLAFRVDERERAVIEERLAALGSPIEARTAASSYARDPEGNRVAISHYRVDRGSEAPDV